MFTVNTLTADDRRKIKSADLVGRFCLPILSDYKKSANFCMSHDRCYRPILSAINLAVDLGSNFTEKIGRLNRATKSVDFIVHLSSALRDMID